MLNKTKKIATHFTGHSLVIQYKINKADTCFELAKGGWCDFNDLDEFCKACIPGYIIGCRSIDQMVDLADKIYRYYTQKNKVTVGQVFFKKQSAKNGMCPSKVKVLRQIGV